MVERNNPMVVPDPGVDDAVAEYLKGMFGQQEPEKERLYGMQCTGGDGRKVYSAPSVFSCRCTSGSLKGTTLSLNLDSKVAWIESNGRKFYGRSTNVITDTQGVFQTVWETWFPDYGDWMYRAMVGGAGSSAASYTACVR